MVESASNQPEQRGELSTAVGAGLNLSISNDLRQVVLGYYQDVYRYAFRLAGTQADAEDLTQQTFLLAHRKLHQLRQADRLKQWLFAILRSCFLKGCRARQPLTGQELAVDEIPDGSFDDDGIDREQLRAALAELPAEFRVVLLMFYFEGCSYKEIAAELDLPTGTVMSRLSRAKGHLRRKLIKSSQSADSRDSDNKRQYAN